MALMRCPECGKEISDKSIQCIYCGAPTAIVRAAHEQAQSSEQTGKKLKMQTIYGMVLFLIGLIILLREIIKAHHGIFFVFGIALILTGLIWGVVVRIRTWWHKRKAARS